ncbi:SRPBCC family protein [Salibacterium salarium]|uniref:SRPBCC family protein n=1 Tax=Salibacterium salarium TaxID=284579 RepID=A0A3R9Q7C1_9BACI|nr:SRPBCC family protein [Salibacterium salarium]RSL35224.1 SRPBCC family protein [Salibacterium salarium]
MKRWKKEIDIDAPIDEVWCLFDQSLENMQKIMPKVIGHEPVKTTEEVVGSVYRQTYQEGSRTAEYDVETLEYVDTDDKKRLKIEFTMSELFEITTAYDLLKLNEYKTRFIYSTTNKPLKWRVKPFLLFASDKAVIAFVERVKRVVEEERA